MGRTILKVRHRHDGAILVAEVGKPLPSHYQRPGRTVARIDDKPIPNPLYCVLDDGEVILIGRSAHTQVTYA